MQEQVKVLGVGLKEPEGHVNFYHIWERIEIQGRWKKRFIEDERNEISGKMEKAAGSNYKKQQSLRIV